MNNLKDRIQHLSLSKKLTLDIIGAFILAGMIIFALYRLTNVFVDNYYSDSNKWFEITEKKVQELQQFVTSKNLSLDQASEISAWIDQNPGVYVCVYDEEYDLYIGSLYGVSYSDLVETELTFSDGTTGLDMCCYINYRYYDLAVALEVVLGMLVFLLLVMHRIRRIVHEIDRIEDDIRILKGGGLEHKIKANGDDELGSLARNLDEMRITLANNIKMEEKLTKANNELVTRMSHDLRTPLTSLLLYLDLIGNKKYSDESQLEKYVSISKSKAEQIKSMSELLFERFLVTGDNENIKSQAVHARYALEDPLSGFVMTLEAHGFVTYTDISWPMVNININPKYIDRILDNLHSNVIKYANKDYPLIITITTDEDSVNVRVVNHIGERSSAEGSGIGIENVRIMMDKMGGSFIFREDGDMYETELSFAIVK